MKLEAKRVNEIFEDCLAGNTQDDSKRIIVRNMITADFAFDADKLKEYEKEIRGLVDELPYTFRASAGGGYSFLMAYMDKDGHHWGEHKDMEQLIALGIGIGYMECLTEYPMAASMPGGMPYYRIMDKVITNG